MANTTEALKNQYRKKPVVIDAIQWTGGNLADVIEFTDGYRPDIKGTHAAMKWEEYRDLVERDGLKIYTLEGKMSASVGDWIIQGVKGELYPCKPDIFAQTYEPVTAASAEEAQPVALHVGKPDGTMDTLGAIYRNRKAAEDHIASYNGELKAAVVPLYAAPQASQPIEELKAKASNSQPVSGSVTDDLIALLKDIKPSYGDVGSRDVDVTVKRNRIDAAIGLLSAGAQAGQSAVAIRNVALEEVKAELLKRGFGYDEWGAVDVVSALQSTPAQPQCQHQFHYFGDQAIERRCVRCNVLESRATPAQTEAQLTAPVTVPEGWKLVPEKPTLAMLEAGSMNIMANTIAGYCYRAMLAAAPAAPVAQAQQSECAGCNGRGEVGGHTQDGSYQTDPCPFCSQQSSDKDAERYRWLTKHAYISRCLTERGEVFVVANVEREVPVDDTYPSVSAAIDSAIAKEKSK